jgi:hypothetical protein
MRYSSRRNPDKEKEFPMLKMKPKCEQCGAATAATAQAYICSFECTFCANCAQAMLCVCPNCQGELVVRPRRTRTVAAVGLAQLKARVFGR